MEQKYRISEQLVWSYRGDICYVVHRNNNKSLYLKYPAIVIWQGIERQYTVKEIIDYLKNTYVQNAEEICLEVIRRLHLDGLIQEDVPYIGEHRTYIYEQHSVKDIYINKVSLVLTDKCNFRCKHCYNTNFYTITQQKMLIEQWKQVIDWAISMGCIMFQITGGEPFSYEHLFEILDYIENKGALFGINTNGSLITDAHIARLKSYKKLSGVSISVYGFTKETYQTMCGISFEPKKIIETYLKMKQVTIPVELKYVFTKWNYEDACKIREYENNYNVCLLKNISYIHPYLRGSKEDMNLNKEQLASLYKAKCVDFSANCDPCIDCSLDRCLIAFDGRVSVCEKLQDIALGSVFDETLDEIWTMERFDEKIRKKCSLELLCGNCEDKNYCTRCNGVSFVTTGELYGCSDDFKRFTKMCVECIKNEGKN